MKYILFSGNLLPKDEKVLSLEDLKQHLPWVTLKIRVEKESVLFAQQHWITLVRLCNEYNCKLPVGLQTVKRLKKEINRLVERNHVIHGCVELKVFRDGNYGASIRSVRHPFWTFPGIGERTSMINLGSYSQIPGWFRRCTLWSEEIKRAEKNGFSNLFVETSEVGIISESLKGCFLVIKGNSALVVGRTKDSNEAIIQYFLEKASLLVDQVVEVAELDTNLLLEADEIFWFDDWYGIQWVMAYEHRRFYNRKSRAIWLKMYQESIKV